MRTKSTYTAKHRLRVYENRVLKRIFGPKNKEVVGSWRRLHNAELHNLYASPNIIRVIRSRKIRREGHIMCMREMKNEYKIVFGKLEGKRPLVRRMCRLGDNSKTNLVTQGSVLWQSLVNTVMIRRVP
jgi:hypothetical protein